jgi:hypothetical protein
MHQAFIMLFLVVYRNCQYISQVHLLLGVLPIIVRLSRLILSLLVLNLDIYGDFNLGGIEWHNYSIKSKAQNTKQCKQLLDICQDNCLEQVVNEETHFTEKSKSILDFTFGVIYHFCRY